MRKLSKKISMLMVLAMLVSLFSGVVSASAASSWSFYNKTADEIVAVKETIEMETNEFADFDLYKDGKTIDTDVYTVKYESDDASVVYVDAKNGKLRAKGEAGEKATVTAVITNKTTKVTAKRSFYIAIADVAEYAIVADFADEVIAVGDKLALAATVTADGKEVEATVAFALDGAAITEFVAAEAGEYTIVATATVAGEVVATEKFVVVAEADVAEIVAAKQTSLTTVEITLNDADWAKKFAENVKLSYFAGDVEIADLVKAATAKDEVVTVTLYNAMAADTTYKFAYDECVATVVGAKSEPAYIKVVGGSVPQTGKVDVKIFTAAGVDITTDELKANVSYKSLDPETCDVTNDDIFFYEIGKSAPVEATYDMGWNEDGEELTDLTAKGVYTSVDEYTYSKPSAYAVGAAGFDNDDIEAQNFTFGSSVTVALDDNYALYAKYVETKYDGTTDDQYICGGADKQTNEYTYYSTNENVVLVDDEDGVLAPCKVGTASVYIKNADDKVVGSVVVIVKEARKLNSFTAKVESKKLSTALDTDSTFITVSAKDQLGADHDVDYTMELVSPLKIGNTDVTLADFFTNDPAALVVADGKIELALDKAAALAAIADGKIQTVTFKIKATDADDANNVKEQRLSVSIKDMTGASVANTTFEVSANNVDTKLDKKNAAAYGVTVKYTKVDKDGYAMGLETLTLGTTANTTEGAYSVVISKGDDKFVDDDKFFNLENNVISINPVVDGTKIEKLANGTYKIQLYKGAGDDVAARPIKVEYLTITDSTAAITADVQEDTIATSNEAGVEAVIDFYYNGTKIDKDNNLDVSEVVDPVTSIDNRYYVKDIKVMVKPVVLNSNSEFTGEFEATVSVNQLFKY